MAVYAIRFVVLEWRLISATAKSPIEETWLEFDTISGSEGSDIIPIDLASDYLLQSGIFCILDSETSLDIGLVKVY